MLNLPGTGRAVGVRCDLRAQAMVSVAAGEIPALRKAPGRLGDDPVAPAVVKHADGQTVVALAAVLKAAEESGLDPAGFGDWGVVAAPRFLGRGAFDVAFPQFLAEGAWGVSPLLISSHSLHSVSGAVSQALNAHGPNLGVGGTPDGEEQAFLAAAVMIAERSAAGVWVVLTGWEPGWDGSGAGGENGDCHGLAVALTAPAAGWLGPKLVISPAEIRVEPTNRRVDAGAPAGREPHRLDAAPARSKGATHG